MDKEELSYRRQCLWICWLSGVGGGNDDDSGKVCDGESGGDNSGNDYSVSDGFVWYW
jgi:hypothetical protein